MRRIYVKNGTLTFQRTPENETQLAPLGEDRYVMIDVPARTIVRFEAASGREPKRMFVSVDDGDPGARNAERDGRHALRDRARVMQGVLVEVHGAERLAAALTTLPLKYSSSPTAFWSSTFIRDLYRRYCRNSDRRPYGDKGRI